MSGTGWNISSKNYTEEEQHQLWGTSTKRLTTYCWMSAVVRTENREVALTSDNSITAIKYHNSSEVVHAECIALRNFEELTENFTKISDKITKNSIFDLAFWITNSPCIQCRKIIYETMQKIHSLHPEMRLRILLFFSSLYCNGLSSVEAISELGEWIIELISVKISVIIGPIIVSELVPKPEIAKESKKIRRILVRQKRDLHSFVFFRKLRRIIRPSLYAKKFSLKSSKTFFDLGPLDENILKDISGNSPFYYSIFPSDSPQLSNLTPVVGLFIYLLIYSIVSRGHCGGDVLLSKMKKRNKPSRNHRELSTNTQDIVYFMLCQYASESLLSICCYFNWVQLFSTQKI